jgi:hypothetical protein
LPAALPGVGDRVRAVGRFYKVWVSEDLGGRQRDYLTFVGRGATWERRTAPEGWRLVLPLVGTVVVLAVVYVGLRRTLGRRLGAGGAAQRPPARPAEVPGDGPAGYDPGLPRDPAEALRRLADQAGAVQESDRKGTREGTRESDRYAPR